MFTIGRFLILIGTISVCRKQVHALRKLLRIKQYLKKQLSKKAVYRRMGRLNDKLKKFFEQRGKTDFPTGYRVRGKTSRPVFLSQFHPGTSHNVNYEFKFSYIFVLMITSKGYLLQQNTYWKNSVCYYFLIANCEVDIKYGQPLFKRLLLHIPIKTSEILAMTFSYPVAKWLSLFNSQGKNGY